MQSRAHWRQACPTSGAEVLGVVLGVAMPRVEVAAAADTMATVAAATGVVVMAAVVAAVGLAVAAAMGGESRSTSTEGMRWSCNAIFYTFVGTMKRSPAAASAERAATAATAAVGTASAADAVARVRAAAGTGVTC